MPTPPVACGPQAEFQAEQEKLQTMSYLSAEEQERYAQRQSISFMYAKPPGLEAALERDRENEAKAKVGHKTYCNSTHGMQAFSRSIQHKGPALYARHMQVGLPLGRPMCAKPLLF